jgi:hypothetical protein
MNQAHSPTFHEPRGIVIQASNTPPWPPGGELPTGRTRTQQGVHSKPMTVTTSPQLGQIHALLAEAGYQVSEPGPDTLRVREVHSGVAVQAVVQGEVMFFSLTCTVVPRAAITPAIMQTMLAADNGISTSHFQIYDADGGNAAVTLNNFCKLREMGPDEEDDILSCVHFLMVDVMTARRLLGSLEK